MIEDFYPKLKKIPAPVYAFFMTDESRILCEEVCMLYGLVEDAIPAVTKPLAELFLKEASLSEYPKMIAYEAMVSAEVAYGVAYEVNKRIFLKFPEYFTDADRLGKEWESKKSALVMSLEEAKQKVFELEPWLLEKDEDEEVAKEERTRVEASHEKLALLSAIGKYPRLGEQQITKERIKLRNQSEPARPSLANWIRVYRDELGVGHHDPMIRGKFLFDSENGKRLSSEERERINIILRSIEENAPLDIDTEKTEIVFPGFASVPVAPKAPAQVAVPREIPVVTPIPVPRPVPTSVPMTASQSDFVPVRPVVPVRRPPSQIRPMTSPFHDTPVFAAPPIPTVATYLPNTAPSREVTFSAPAPSQNVTPPTPSAPIAGLPTPPQAPVRRPVSFAPEPPPDLPVGGTFSFSSSHALPIESEEGKFSIHDSETDEADDSLSHSPTLPSAIPIFGNANLIPLASSDRNPFHIHPVGIREEKKKPDDDTGRTVDLRG